MTCRRTAPFLAASCPPSTGKVERAFAGRTRVADTKNEPIYRLKSVPLMLRFALSSLLSSSLSSSSSSTSASSPSSSSSSPTRRHHRHRRGHRGQRRHHYRHRHRRHRRHRRNRRHRHHRCRRSHRRRPADIIVIVNRVIAAFAVVRSSSSSS